MSEEDLGDLLSQAEAKEEQIGKKAKEMEKDMLKNTDLGILPYLPYLFMMLIGFIVIHPLFISIPKFGFVLLSIVLSTILILFSYSIVGLYSMTILQQKAGSSLIQNLMKNKEKKEKDPNYFG